MRTRQRPNGLRRLGLSTQAIPGPEADPLRPLWASLGSLWASLRSLWASLGPVWASLGPVPAADGHTRPEEDLGAVLAVRFPRRPHLGRPDRTARARGKCRHIRNAATKPRTLFLDVAAVAAVAAAEGRWRSALPLEPTPLAQIQTRNKRMPKNSLTRLRT